MNDKVFQLTQRKQLKQLSPEWFAARPHMITASSAASLLVRDDKTCDSYINSFNLHDIFDKDKKCCNPYSSKNQYFLDRCRGSSFTGSAATYWGQKYEDIAVAIYSNINDTEVLEFGLLVHPELNWIGASPDGITPAGIMVEIKCPYRRRITGIPPFYYWQQCQLQLEVCDLEVCDFTEFEFVEFDTEEEWDDDETIVSEEPLKFKGLFIQIECIAGDGSVLPQHNKYIYPPRNLLIDSNKFKLKEWASDQLITNKHNSSITYWKVFNYCITKIVRDKNWFSGVLPDFEKEWARLAFYKKNENYKHLLSNRSSGKLRVLTLSEDSDEECILDSD